MKLKKFVIVVLLFILSDFCFSHGGVLSGYKNVKVARTQWFDIIYPEECEISAQILYEKADSLYDELCVAYNYQRKFRMPVVITPAVENFNAYYTSYPYNHIVLFDTGIVESLEVFTETILSVFKHELTHAVTLNLTNPFFTLLSLLFCDGFNIGNIFISSGIAEAATVSWESMNGEGRLNSDYALQPLRQSKIEENFPSFYDMQGARDIYPAGTYYMYNGAFAEWLQENFGMKKYAEFYYELSNFGGISTGSIFKKVYGIKLKDAWSKFYSDLEIPKVHSNPVKAKEVKDFFNTNKDDYSINNKKGGLYSHLTKGKNGFAYLEELTETVYFMNKENKPQKLFSQNNITSINLSADSDFIVVDFLDISGPVIKSKIRIYDINNKKWIKIPDTGIAKGTIVKTEEKTYLVCQHSLSQNYKIRIYEVKPEQETVEIKREIPFEYNNVPSNFVDIGNGNFAYKLKSGLNISLVVSDIEGNEKQIIKIKNEDIAEIRHLSSDLHLQKQKDSGKEATKLVFSCTKKGALPRLGILDLEKNNLYVVNKDISGGIYYPSFGDSEKTIAYIGEFSEQNRILLLDLNNLELSESELEISYVEDQNKKEDFTLAEKVDSYSQQTINNKEIQKNILENSTELKPAKYLLNGVFIPLSSTPFYSIEDLSISERFLMYGLTYISGFPWDEVTGIEISFGFDKKFENYGSFAKYSYGTDSNSFNFSTELSLGFDKKGFNQIINSTNITTNIPIYNFLSFSIADYELIGFMKDNKFLNQNIFSFGISNVHRGDTNYISKTGFSFRTILQTSFIKNNAQKNFFGDIGFSIGVGIPSFLPIRCVYPFVYNLPSIISLELFCDTQENNSFEYCTGLIPAFDLLCVEFSTVLFANEIQKAVSFFPVIYANKFKITFDYKGGYKSENKMDCWKIANAGKYWNMIKNNELQWENCIVASLKFEITPNIGRLANPVFKSELYVKAGYVFNKNKQNPLIKLGIYTDF